MSGNSDTIKVVGYAKRTFYDNGIEYRNFTDDLVGNQLTSDADGTDSVFTYGNFVTTVNYEGRLSRIFSTKKFSSFYSLSTLNLDDKKANVLLSNNINTVINVDRTNLGSFAYFGSSTEFVRVSLEKIITNWPAALYIYPFRNDGDITIVGDTFSDYTFNFNLQKSTFNVDNNFIINNYEINYKSNGTNIDTFNEDNDLRNLTINYLDYVVYYNDTEYPIIGFQSSPGNRNGTLTFEVDGDPFGSVSSTTIEYHIKPKKELEEEFFNSLNEYESYLLNRLVTPKYTSKYNYKIVSDNGRIINASKTLTWPVTDGYNIDFNTAEYATFVTDLLSVTEGKDSVETNLMVRFLTSESISDFDTLPKCDGTEEETAGQKMNKTLKIYGREFDEIKKYIDGISFANVVTYDKQANIPDQLVKYLARTLGWEITSSIVDNDLINNYLKIGGSSYPGESRGLSANEAEVELWRRLILNSAHIWKNKGNRNPIEFFFKLIGVPDGLIDFNEHIYLAKEPIDMDLFYKILDNNNLSTDLSLYNIDSEGYPRFNRNTSDMWFQKGGGWYRQTAGSAATEYTLIGNNPHVGPYDGGYEYIAQLDNIVPNFSAFTITSTTVTSATTQLFTNYNSGLINGYSSTYYVEAQSLDGAELNDLVLLTTSTIKDICPQVELTDCGCDPKDEDDAMIIDIKNADIGFIPTECEGVQFEYIDYESGVGPYNHSLRWANNHYYWKLPSTNSNGGNSTYLNKYYRQECCQKVAQGYPYYLKEYIYPVTAGGIYSTGSQSQTLNLNVYSSTLQNFSDGTSPYTFQQMQDFKYKFWIGNNKRDVVKYTEGYICCTSPGAGVEDFNSNGCGCDLSCGWLLAGPTLEDMYFMNNSYYLKFEDLEGSTVITNPADSCFCSTLVQTEIGNHVIPEEIIDPITGQSGYACKLNDTGVLYFVSNNTVDDNYYYAVFHNRRNGFAPCNDIDSPFLIKSDWYTKSLYE